LSDLKNSELSDVGLASRNSSVPHTAETQNSQTPDAQDSAFQEPAPSANANRYEPVTAVRRFPPPVADIHPDRSLGWLKRLWPLVAAHKPLVVIGVIGGLVGLGTQVAVPLAARQAIDVAEAAASGSLAFWIWMLGALGVARIIFSIAYRYSLFKLAFRIDTELRILIYNHLGRLSFSYYDRTQSGDVISRANSDIRSIQIFFSFAPIAVIAILSFVFSFTAMLLIHVPLALVAMSTLPWVHYFGMRFRRVVFPLSWIAQARMAEVAAIVDENVNGTRVVKSFAAEKQQIRILSKSAQRLQWAATATAEARARFNPLIEALPRISMALMLLYGGWLVIEDQTTVGTLFAFMAYVLMLQMPFRLVGFLLTQGQRAAASAKRIYEVLDEQPEVVEAPDAQTLEQCDGELRFEDVWFAYPQYPKADEDLEADEAPETTEPSQNGQGSQNGQAGQGRQASQDVLRGFNLHVKPGETVALVGATGSGKSTIARLLARFYDIDRGAVLVDNQDVRDLQVASLRHHVGMVFDEPFLFSESLADNIAYGRPDASQPDIQAAAKAAQAHDFIQALPKGYDTVVGERGYTLSGGQRQRVALARTLLERPQILILDDATSAVDVHVEAQIHSALKQQLKGRTTILISHRLSTIALADRVVLLRDGKVSAEGTHEELLESEPYYAQVLTDTSADSNGTGAAITVAATANTAAAATTATPAQMPATPLEGPA